VEIFYELKGESYKVTQEDVLGKSEPIELPGFIIRDYTQDNTIERYIFSWPIQGGTWRINAYDCNGLEGYYQRLRAVSEGTPVKYDSYPQIIEDPYYDPENPVLVQYKLLEEESGRVIPEDPLYPVEFLVTIVDPDGNESTLNLKYDESLQVFSNKNCVANGDCIDVRTVGIYQITGVASVTYTNLDTDEVITRNLYDEREDSAEGFSTFEVTNVETFSVKVLEPLSDPEISSDARFILHGNIPKLELQPVSFRVVLVGSSGNKLNPELVLENHESALVGTVLVEDRAMSSNVELIPDPEDPYAYVGTITALDAEGYHQFVVELADGFVYDKTKYWPETTEAQIRFEMYDTLWTRASTYKGIAVALGLLGFFGVVRFFAARRNPVRGELIFELGSSMIATIPLYSGKHVTKVAKKTLQAYENLNLVSLRAEKSTTNPEGITFEIVDGDGIHHRNSDFSPYQIENFPGGITMRYEAHDKSM